MANEAGQGCTERAISGPNITRVSYGAPASTGGSVTRLAMANRAAVGTGEARFAFFTASGNDLTAVAGSRQTGLAYDATSAGCKEFTSGNDDFTAFNVSAGNYLGCWCDKGLSFTASGGTGYWAYAGDGTEADGLTFTLDDNGIDSLTADITASGGIAMPLVMLQHNHFNGGILL